MGNLIHGSVRKSVPQVNYNRNEVQEEFFQAIRNNDVCTLESLLCRCPDAIKGVSTIASLLANEPEAESITNRRLKSHVDSRRRGGKKHTGFHCHGPARPRSKCYFVSIHQRLDPRNREARFSKQDTLSWLPVCQPPTPNPLHKCVCLGTLHLIPFFVHNGISTDETDLSGLTALHLACQMLKTEAVKVLLCCGADVNLTSPETGQSALHFATQSASSKGGVTLAAGAECIELLLRHGAGVRVRGRNGKAAIHLACQCGREDLVTLLLEYGADVNSLTSAQESPLFLFLEGRRTLRHAQLLNKLLSLSYPLKLTNSEGCLPKGLLFPYARRLKDTLLRMTSEVLPLQEICKFNIRKRYGGPMKCWLEMKLPTSLWKSIYVDQEYSYASKIKALY